MLWPYPSLDLCGRAQVRGKLQGTWSSKSHNMRGRGHTTQHPGSHFALPTYGCWGASQELSWLAFRGLGKGLRGSGRHCIAVDSGVLVGYN